jgi:uncharacterized protein
MTESSPPVSAPPPPSVPPSSGGYQGPAPDKDAINMAMLSHLLGLFTGFLGPLIIWLMKKDSHPFVDDQGKESLNFQIAAALATLVCIPLIWLFCLGAILIPAVQITRIVFSIIGTVNANKGVAYRYPLNLRLIK